MAKKKILIGNIKGPQGNPGPQGDPGIQGPQGAVGPTGNQGAQGIRGSNWYTGTTVTGTNTSDTVFKDSGIQNALANDLYLNTSDSNVYKCTVAGDPTTAKWIYIGNIKGLKGDPGPTGAKGADGKDGADGAVGPKGDPGKDGVADTTFDPLTELTALVSGESFNLILGKLASAVEEVIKYRDAFQKLTMTGELNDTITDSSGEVLLDSSGNELLSRTLFIRKSDN